MSTRRRRPPLSTEIPEDPDMGQALQPGATAPTSVTPITPPRSAPGGTPPIAAAAPPLSGQMAAQQGFRTGQASARELRNARPAVPVDVAQGGEMAAQRAYQQGRISQEEMRSMSGQAMGKNLAQQKFDAVMQPARTQIAQEQFAQAQEAHREQGFADMEREGQIKSDIAMEENRVKEDEGAKREAAARKALMDEKSARADELLRQQAETEGWSTDELKQAKRNWEMREMELDKALPPKITPEEEWGTPYGPGTREIDGEVYRIDPTGKNDPKLVRGKPTVEKPEKPAPAMTPQQKYSAMESIRQSLQQKEDRVSEEKKTALVTVTDEQVRTEFNRRMKLAEEDGEEAPAAGPAAAPAAAPAATGKQGGKGLKITTITNKAGVKVDQYRNEAGEYLADVFADGKVVNMVGNNWTPPPKVNDPSEVDSLVKSGKLKPGQFFQNEKGEFLQVPGNYKAK